MKDKKTIHVLVINYKQYKKLSAVLSNLSLIHIPNKITLEIIVIDQLYSEEMITKIHKKFPLIHIIREKKNLGVSGAFNIGFRYGLKNNADFFLMLTPDIFVEKKIVEKLLDKMNSDKNIGMVSSKLYYNTNPPRILFVGGILDPKIHSTIHLGAKELDKGQFDSLKETEILNFPVLLKSEVIKMIGFMEEGYFMYYEDIDLYLRTRKAGYKLAIATNTISFTELPSNNEKIAARKSYYLSRNLLYFIRRNYSLREQVIAYMYILKGYLLKTFQKRDFSYYSLLGIVDFILGKKGYKEFEL